MKPLGFLVLLIAVVNGIGQVPDLRVSNPTWFLDTWVRLVPANSFDPDSKQLRSDQYFIYEATFENNTGKKIKGVTWGHVFSALEGNVELKRHAFGHIVPLKGGARRKIQNSSRSPPTNLVRVEELKKNSDSPYRQRIVIKCIVFGDNTIWKAEKAAQGDCDELKRNVARREERIKK